MAKARLRRGIELVKLANRIEALKIAEDEDQDSDVPADSKAAAGAALSKTEGGDGSRGLATGGGEKKSLSKIAKGAIFREVVLAKVREMKEQESALKVTEEVKKEHKRKSYQGSSG